MAKINATYSSGYYISPDTDFRKLEEQQANERKSLRKRGRDGDGGEDDPDVIKANTKRQTFAIPFDLYCDHCERRIPRGAHVYTNRRPTRMKYLNAIRIWELEIRCQYCSGLYYLQTDPETPKETGGYKCVRNCHRAEGDFLALNAKNAAAKAQWEKERAEAEANPLAALERENEASRELAERNRRIEEDVLARADAEDDASLLAAMRRRRQQQDGQQQDGPEPRGSGLSSFSSSKYTFETRGGDDMADDDDGGELRLSPEELAAEEAAYEQFEAEMHTRWQEAQAAAAKQARIAEGLDGVSSSLGHSWFGVAEKKDGSDDNALAEALARYGSARRDGMPSMAVTAKGRKNAFVAPDSDEDSIGDEDGREAPPPPPPPPSPAFRRNGSRKPSLLSGLGDSDSDTDS